MNWTEGGLSRSRNAKGSLSAKQKSYFAKARNSRSPRPTIQSFDLGGWKPTVKIAGSLRSHEGPIRQGSSQMTLDYFENVEPIIKRLDSLRPRNTPSKRKRSPPQPSPGQIIREGAEVHKPIVIGSSSSTSSTSSPPARSTRSLHFRRRSGIPSENTSIEAKRLQLLQMNDWVGLHRPVTEPVRMKFADPADRDLIGRRRRITEVDHHRSVRRRLLPSGLPSSMERLTNVRTIHDQTYGIDDVSVRIGSAVDKSVRERAHGSLGSKERNSTFSDELLDNGTPELVQMVSSPIPGPKYSRSASLRLSDYGNSRVLTPSAFMYGSSSRASPYSQGFVESSLPPSSSVMESESLRSRRIACGSEFELPAEKPPTGVRPIFDDTPSYHALEPVSESANHSSPYFPIHDRGIAATVPRHSISPDNLSIWQTDLMARHRDPRAHGHTVAAPYQATRQSSKELNIAGRLATSSEFLEDSIREAQDSEEQLGPRPCEDILSSDDSERRDDTAETRAPSQASVLPAKEEELEQKESATSPEQDHAVVSRNQASSTKEPVLVISEKSNLDQTPPKLTDQDSSKAFADEEAIWRKFVFGDEDYNLEEAQEIDSQDRHLTCTQPSLVAEVATSPFKQNPHLADDTFDSSSLYLNAAWPDVPSASSTPQPDIPQISGRNLNASSLVGEASSSSQLTNHSLIPNVSSDEVHRSSDRVAYITDSRNQQRNDTGISSTPPNAGATHHTSQAPPKQKVIYKKPPRYIGEQSSDPTGPTILGERVLRSGRRVNNKPKNSVKNKRGKGKKEIEKREETINSDDIVDD